MKNFLFVYRPIKLSPAAQGSVLYMLGPHVHAAGLYFILVRINLFTIIPTLCSTVAVILTH